MTLADKSSVIYTLKDTDHKGYDSLYRLYMEVLDPTEYRFANSYLDGWGHWKQLSVCNWFKPYIDRWREELQLKIASEALTRIMAEASTDRKESFAANKYLLEKGWQPKGADKVGRPSKEAIQDAASRMVKDNSRVLTDWDRLGVATVATDY